MTKDELVESIRAEWEALMGVVGKLSEGQMVMPDEGGWSPKDNLAHLSEWMKILMGCYMDKRTPDDVAGIPPDVASRWNMEEINPILFQRNHQRSTEDVLHELQGVYAKLISRLEAMTTADLLKPMREDDPEGTPLIDYVIGDTSDHFAEHRATLEKSM
jgi:hypothetical protein